MRTTLLACVFAAAAMFGCGSSGDDTSDDDGDDGDDTAQVDAAGELPLCTGAPYDSCMDTAGGTDCLDGQECRFFMGQGFTICTPTCDVDTPCPPDENGTPVTCNMMGRCRSEAPNSCMLPP